MTCHQTYSPTPSLHASALWLEAAARRASSAAERQRYMDAAQAMRGILHAAINEEGQQ